MSASVTLYLPGLLSTWLKDDTQFSHGENADSPLALILSRASCHPHASDRYESGLKSLFKGINTATIPEAALGAYYYGLDPQNEFWCRMDPIECALDTHSAYVMGNQHLQLHSAESLRLIQELKDAIPDLSTLNAPMPEEWYLQVKSHIDVVMNDLMDVIHKNMALVLPSGPDQIYWHKLLTECQMILNKESKQVSSVWFWGLGQLPTAISTGYDCIYTSESAVHGLAKCAGVISDPLPQQWTLKKNHTLIVDRRFEVLFKYQEYQKWLALLQYYSEHYFAALLQDLRQNKIAELKILPGDGRIFNLRKKYLHYFWRIKKPLSALVA